MQPPGGRLLTAIPLPRCAPNPPASAPLGLLPAGVSKRCPPPSPPAGLPTGPLRAVPRGQPGPSSAAGWGSAAVPRPGPPTGPLRAVPLAKAWPARPRCCCWPGLRSGAVTVAVATAVWTAPSPAARRLPWPARPQCCCWPGIRSGPAAAPPLAPQHGPLRADGPHQQASVPAAVGPSAAGLYHRQLPTACCLQVTRHAGHWQPQP